jgi:hypothetical protein
MVNFDVPSSPVGVYLTPCRAISFDGGKTWPEPYDGITPQPYNGPINIQPSGPVGLGDNPGVQADKFGNFWSINTNFSDDSDNVINLPYVMLSADGGITYSLAFTFPGPATDFLYDFPQYCFGGDGNGNYGLQFVVDYINGDTDDVCPFVGFIPITGLGEYNEEAIQTAYLTNFTNIDTATVPAASADGRVWLYGIPWGGEGSSITSSRIIYKSPGSITENYAGSWDFAMANFLNIDWQLPLFISQPGSRGYFYVPRDIIYDESRQALYAVTIANQPDFSQNMQIYLAISRDNGSTWSSPVAIATTDFANRGFVSMALDRVTGNLLFGWYDGRNDPTYQSVEYYAAILTSKQLDKLVKDIPLSDPLYAIPAAANEPKKNARSKKSRPLTRTAYASRTTPRR